MSILQWQANSKRRSSGDFTHHIKTPPVLVNNNIVRYGKAETGTLANIFGCVEGVKDAREIFGFNAAPTVTDGDFNRCFLRPRYNTDLSQVTDGMGSIDKNI